MSRPEKYPRIGDKKVYDARFDSIFRKPKAKKAAKPKNLEQVVLAKLGPAIA